MENLLVFFSDIVIDRMVVVVKELLLINIVLPSFTIAYRDFELKFIYLFKFPYMQFGNFEFI